MCYSNLKAEKIPRQYGNINKEEIETYRPCKIVSPIYFFHHIVKYTASKGKEDY